MVHLDSAKYIYFTSVLHKTQTARCLHWSSLYYQLARTVVFKPGGLWSPVHVKSPAPFKGQGKGEVAAWLLGSHSCWGMGAIFSLPGVLPGSKGRGESCGPLAEFPVAGYELKFQSQLKRKSNIHFDWGWNFHSFPAAKTSAINLQDSPKPPELAWSLGWLAPPPISLQKWDPMDCVTAEVLPLQRLREREYNWAREW